MGSESERKATSLIDQLLGEPHRFEFFQAVRLLERLYLDRSRQDPRWQRHPVGWDRAPNQEVVRFRAMTSLSFPAAAISDVRQPRQDDAVPDWELSPPEMIVTFMGLTGPSGVLPQHYTRLLLERMREKDYSLRDFLDLFNHRAISLFYRAWEKYRFPIAYERSKLYPSRDKDDFFTWCLYCLLGLGTANLRRRQEIDDETFLYYGGHFGHYPRSAIALEGILCDYFELAVRVEQFQGQWLYLSLDDRSLLPSPGRPDGLNNQVAVNLVVGERVWDVQSKFRLCAGPLTYEQFRSFMPSGGALRPLLQLTRSYVGPEFDFDVQPVLKASEVPWCRLSIDGPDPPRLGWNTWVRCQEFAEDVADAVFFLDHV